MLQWILIFAFRCEKGIYSLWKGFWKECPLQIAVDINGCSSAALNSTYDILFILNFCINMYMQTFAVC